MKKRQKKNRFKLWLLVGVIILALLFAGSLYGAYYPKLTIASISVDGNKTVSDYDIRQIVNRELAGKYLWFYPKRNSLLFPRAQVTEAVAKTFPRLSSVKLEQENLQSLKLLVAERSGRFLWCLPDSNCYFADQTGFVFAPAPKFSSPLYFEFVSNNIVDPVGKYPLPAADLKKLIDWQKQLADILAGSLFKEQKVYQVAPAELRDWYFQVGSSADSEATWEIRVDLDQDSALAMQTLKSVLLDANFINDCQKHNLSLEYIDLRFAPKVFYRYNNQ